MLDPACGSGTFLFTGIRMLSESGLKGSKLVDFVTSNIVGFDVHPVAVTIAKINYVLALSSELVGYTKSVAVPIYLSDSLIAKIVATLLGEKISIEVNEKEVFNIPKESAERPEDLDQIVDEMMVYANKPNEDSKGFDVFLQSRVLDESKYFWKQNLELMRNLINEGRDTIWSYILKNFSRPLFFSKQKFDLIAGNPPWLSYRYVKDPNYQTQIKRLVYYYNLINKGDGRLITQMDTSTLFYVLSSDMYLKEDGKIAFVLPRSVITGAKHHEKFKEILSGTIGSSVYLPLLELIDLDEVQNLFHVPSCVLVSKKRFEKNIEHITRLSVTGILRSRNSILTQVENELTFDKAETHIDEISSSSMKKSYYYNRFKQGATIVPRFMWFVQPAATTGVGVINANKPSLTTESGIEVKAKDTWKGRLMSGSVESHFLFASVLAEGLIPFGYLRLNLLVLPLNISIGKYKMTDSKGALEEGFSGASKWFHDCEILWDTNKMGFSE
jgi:hypothetical protein